MNRLFDFLLVPKKPSLIFEGGKEGICPTCGSLIFKHEDRCPSCGQLLVWEGNVGRDDDGRG